MAFYFPLRIRRICITTLRVHSTSISYLLSRRGQSLTSRALLTARYSGRSSDAETSTTNAAATTVEQASEPQRLTKLWNLFGIYEDVIGLTAIKEAQRSVIQAEDAFANAQEERRELQNSIRVIQSRLKDIHSDLDKTSRGEDQYLTLLTDEHGLIKQERASLDRFRMLEERERGLFHKLSACLRDSHEKERQRGERTKYWSLIGSLVGAAIGVIGATVSNQLRLRQLRQLVSNSSDQSVELVNHVTALVQSQQEQVLAFLRDVRAFINQEDKVVVVSSAGPSSAVNGPSSASQVLSDVRLQQEKLGVDMVELKRLLAAEYGYRPETPAAADGDVRGSVVYVGPEMSRLLEETERNLEWKMKLQTVLNVVMTYAALALTIPVMYALFSRGGA